MGGRGENNVVCECDHLTSFGLLVNTSRLLVNTSRQPVPEYNIVHFTSLGPVILLILLLLVIFSYLISG